MSPLLLWMTGSYLLVKWMANCQQFTTKMVLLYFLPRFPTVRLQLSAVRNKMRSTTQSSMLEILMGTFTQSTKRERSSKPQSCKQGRVKSTQLSTGTSIQFMPTQAVEAQVSLMQQQTSGRVTFPQQVLTTPMMEMVPFIRRKELETTMSSSMMQEHPLKLLQHAQLNPEPK